ncbi:hypothetical protein [Nonomuraea sp. NPDC049028]
MPGPHATGVQDLSPTWDFRGSRTPPPIRQFGDAVTFSSDTGGTTVRLPG